MAILLACLFNACKDDELDMPSSNESPDWDMTSDYSINFIVTLEAMGASDDSYDNNPMAAIESYIDPQKFRVLFFDKYDRFIFESKSRWVKQLETTSNNFSQWFVSVPFFDYGNDTEYEWDWVKIREILTEEDSEFKIVILANRPLTEWCPEFKDTHIYNGPSWFDNTGPHWRKEDTVWFYDDPKSEDAIANIKELFDLHHSQWDPVYEGKSFPKSNGNLRSYGGYYTFIMGTMKDPSDESNSLPTMSSTASWVDWGDSDVGNRDPYDWKMRKSVAPTYDHPIPMYGMQKFKSISEKDWPIGTTFDLGREDDKPISMLRSVVKIELIVPKNNGNLEVKFVNLWFSNLYSRCEPMNVWTPTDELWNGKEENSSHEAICEMQNLRDYGPMARYNDTNDEAKSMQDYRNRISWLYGAWQDYGNKKVEDGQWTEDQKWKFEDGVNGDVTITKTNQAGKQVPHPQIFNTCIQRNSAIFCYDEDYNILNHDDIDDSYHFIVYTGERNINDPSALYNLGDHANGKAPIIYWQLYIEDKKNSRNSKLYCIPIAEDPGDNVFSDGYDFNTKTWQTGKPIAPSLGEWDSNKNEWKLSSQMGSFEEYVFNWNYNTVNSANFDVKKMPWPLIRNHVYRLTMTSKESGSSNGMPRKLSDKNNLPFIIKGKKFHSHKIMFREAIEQLNMRSANKTEKVQQANQPRAKLTAN